MIKDKLIIPEWFKIGAKIWTMNCGSATEVISIDWKSKLWLGRNVLGYGECQYQLRDVEKLWIHSLKDIVK